MKDLRIIFAFYFIVYLCQLNGGEPTDNLLEMVCICVESFYIYLYLDICRKIFISLSVKYFQRDCWF